MSINIIEQMLTLTKLDNAQRRRNEIKKFLNYYSGTSTEQYIEKFFTGDAFTEIPPSLTNFTRKFINKISRIYTLGAKRNAGDKTDVYEKLTPNKDVRMKHSERMTRLVGTIANRVFWADGRFDYRPIYYFEAYFGSNPFVPEAIVYPLLNQSADLSNTVGLQWSYWDKDQNLILDGDGTELSSQENPYGILPFVFTHREDQIDSFFVEGAIDIVNSNEQVNIGLTELNLGMRFNMFGQPWMNGVFADGKVVRAGSNEILDMGDDGSYNVTAPEGNIEEAINNIKFQIELVATNNHLWVQWAESGGEVPSGISLMIKDLERKEDYFDDIALWRLYEQEFYSVERAIAHHNGISLPEEFGVDFEEVDYPTTVQDQILRDNFDLQNNLITRAQIKVRDNKDLTEEQAQREIDANREQNDKEAKQSIFNQFGQEAEEDQ